jgi:uncharacterized protein (DUF2141 family)
MKPIRIAVSLAATLSLVAAPLHAVLAQPDHGPIQVVVWNIHKSGGHVRVGICNRATFINPKKECPYHADAVAKPGETVVVIPDVPAGSYAAQVFQDVHDDHRVRRSLFGLPMVGIGFSNDAPTPMTAPKFEDAAFSYDPAAPLTLRIKLRYFPHL